VGVRIAVANKDHDLARRRRGIDLAVRRSRGTERPLVSPVLGAEAFAKTNLLLRVVGRRPDGYHELDTIFQTIDLTDFLEVSEAAAIELECDDPRLPTGLENLVTRAATRLAEAFGVRRGARIQLTKRIPVGAGLGGGSSDAAVALGLLARFWSLPSAGESLLKIARDLGSDVPFFLYGGTARGTGRGDILRPLSDGEQRRLVLIVPPFPISTADVYGRLRTGGENDSTRGEVGTYFGINDLASAVLEIRPEMVDYMKKITKVFPDCQISGSGSSIVALAPGDSGTGLEELRNRLPEARVYPIKTVPRAEYRRRSKLDAFDLPREVMES